MGGGGKEGRGFGKKYWGALAKGQGKEKEDTKEPLNCKKGMN